MKKAYVFGNKINAIYTQDQYDSFVSTKEYNLLSYIVDVPDDAQVGWVLIDGQFKEVVSSLESRKETIVKKIKKMMDETASTYKFDNIDTACIYAGSDNAFSELSKSFVKWRAAIWVACETYMQKVLAGEIVAGTDEEIIDSLPKISDFIADS